MTNKSESAADDFSQVAQQFRVFGLRRSLLRYPRRVGAGTGVGVPGNPRIGFSEAGKSLAAVYWPHGTQVGWFATSIGCPGLIPRPTANLTDGADGALDVESDPVIFAHRSILVLPMAHPPSPRRSPSCKAFEANRSLTALHVSEPQTSQRFGLA